MRRLLIFILLLYVVNGIAQQYKPYLSERIFVSPVNTVYELGDTVEVVGQLLSTDYADFYPYSRYVYVDLLDNKNVIVKTLKLKCRDDGSFFTAFTVGNNDAGVYHLRGYTRFMCNQKEVLYPTSTFYYGVYTPRKTENSDDVVNDGLNIAFFPEGGHLTGGVLQNMGVYAYDNDKRPVKTDFCIVKDDKDTLCYGSTSNGGWAKFSFIPDSRSQYTIHAGHEYGQSYLLPSAIDVPSIRAYLNKNKLVCSILKSSDNNSWKSAQHVLLYHNAFGLKEMTIINGFGVADISSCGDGVLTLWLTDSTYNAVAQRSLWVGSDGMAMPNVTVSVADKPGSSIIVAIPDTSCAYRTFVRFLPEGCSSTARCAYNTLNFENDIQSAVPMPDFTFGGAGERNEYSRDIDCWLLSAVRTMPDVRQMDKDTVLYEFAPEYTMSIAGEVKEDKTPLKNAQVQVLNMSTLQAAMGMTDKNGRFLIAIDDCYEDEKLFLQAYDKNGKTRKFGFTIDEEPVPVFSANNTVPQLKTSYRPMIMDTLDRYSIDEVIVKKKAVNKDPYKWGRVKKLYNYYDRQFLESHKSIFDVGDAVLYYNKVGITSDKSCVYWLNPKYNSVSETYLKPKQDNTTNLDTKIAFVVNGLLVDRQISDILDLPITDVESIELVEPVDGRSAWYGAKYGFFDIKLRSGMSVKEISSNGVTVRPRGLSAPLKQQECRMPQRKGRYRMLVDVVGANRTIYSFSKIVEVK